MRISPTTRRRTAIILYTVAAILLALWIALNIGAHRIYWHGLLAIVGMLLAATSVAVGGARKSPPRR